MSKKSNDVDAFLREHKAKQATLRPQLDPAISFLAELAQQVGHDRFGKQMLFNTGGRGFGHLNLNVGFEQASKADEFQEWAPHVTLDLSETSATVFLARNEEDGYVRGHGCTVLNFNTAAEAINVFKDKVQEFKEQELSRWTWQPI